MLANTRSGQDKARQGSEVVRLALLILGAAIQRHGDRDVRRVAVERMDAEPPITVICQTGVTRCEVADKKQTRPYSFQLHSNF